MPTMVFLYRQHFRQQYAVVGNLSFWYRVGQRGGDATIVERWDGRVVQFWARIWCCRDF
ncbi:unnamed protein product [Ectocarpus sp. CCAP 1310/34]|nr:unnamed protein product [Ectocarpus sp. CCAP 1310/34]